MEIDMKQSKKEKRTLINEMKLTVAAVSENEALARVCVASFAASLDPCVDSLADLRCAVSEAVTNCIVHAYKDKKGYVYINARAYSDGTVSVRITDKGCGIEDVERAMQPMFTTGNSEERFGMGFCVMQSFTDSLTVTSQKGKGTSVFMTKRLV